MIKPLENIMVVDFSQFLSAPSCTLRLADLGADVIKIEKPVTGDICRSLYVSDLKIDGESSLFHAINRNKKSLVLDLKTEEDIEKVKKLIKVADVVVHNFRPGVMEKLGLSYQELAVLNPGLVYATVSGYGEETSFRNEPGQDLLVQAISGLSWLSGSANDGPVPMGVSVVDILAGTYLAQGIMAAIYEKENTGIGSLVEVNMLESSLEFQFEVFTTFLNDGNELPSRSTQNPVHAYLAAPYGVYKTANGFISLAMGSISQIGELVDCAPLKIMTEPAEWFIRRDEIKSILADHLAQQSTSHWLEVLEPADIWCAEVLDYSTLMNSDGYKVLEMEQMIVTGKGTNVKTTRCPIKIDGEFLTNAKGAPFLGEDTESLIQEYSIDRISSNIY